MFLIRTFVKTNSGLMCGSFSLCKVIARTTEAKTKFKIISLIQKYSHTQYKNILNIKYKTYNDGYMY